jgi:hypothetical protein
MFKVEGKKKKSGGLGSNNGDSSKKTSKLKKAAVIGAGAYTVYQHSKAKPRSEY